MKSTINTILSYCDRFLDIMNGFCLKISMILLFGMLSIVTLNVILRYIFHYSITWTEESARFMMVWITFLLLPWVQHKGQHVAVDFLILPWRYTRAGVVLAIIMEALILMILYNCILQAVGFMQRFSSVSMALQLPMKYVSVVLPYSFTMACFASLVWFCRLVPCLFDPAHLREIDVRRANSAVEPQH